MLKYVACLCRNGFTLWDFIRTSVKLTILPRRVLWIERLYIIWGYSVAMETTGVWSLGWYRIGPSRMMRALLLSTSAETSGGPKLAVKSDIIIQSFIYYYYYFLDELMSFWLTVRLWIESPRRCPFGGCSLVHCANSGKVSLLHVPHLNAQVAPALHYFCAPLYRPPVHPPPFPSHRTVPVTGRDKRTVIKAWLFKPPPELGQQERRGELQILCFFFSFCSPSSNKLRLM